MTEPPRDPRVSVLIPIRDGRAWLDELLGSLARSSEERWEAVFVDDGSTDGSAERLDAAAGADPRVRVLHRPAQGLVPALNAGLAACRAPLVARLDADDRLDPDRLGIQAARLDSEPEIALVGSAVRLFPAEAVTDGMRRYADWQNGLDSEDAVRRDLFVESPLAHPGVMFRRDVVRRLDGYRDFDGPEDYDLWLRLFEAGERMAPCPGSLVEWRQHSDRLTWRDPRYRPEAFLDLKLDVLLRTRLAGAESVGIAGAGRDGKRVGRALLARGLRIDCWFELNPRKLGRRIHGGEVLAYEAIAERRERLPHLLAVVGVPGARDTIRASFESAGLVEERDFTCLA